MTEYECNISGLSRQEKAPYLGNSSYGPSFSMGFYDSISTSKDLGIDIGDQNFEGQVNQYDTEKPQDLVDLMSR